MFTHFFTVGVVSLLEIIWIAVLSKKLTLEYILNEWIIPFQKEI